MAELTGTQLLEKDLRKYCENYMRHLATIVGDELVEAARDAIEAFYADYPNPKSYRRHFYNLRNNSFRRYYSNKHGGNTYVAGVQFTPETMDDIYNASTKQVLNSVLDGFHGLPYDHTVNKKTGEPKHDPIGFGFWNDNGVINHTGKIGRTDLAIPRMSPSPLELVQQKRDEILENMDNYNQQAEILANKHHYSLIR